MMRPICVAQMADSEKLIYKLIILKFTVLFWSNFFIKILNKFTKRNKSGVIAWNTIPNFMNIMLRTMNDITIHTNINEIIISV